MNQKDEDRTCWCDDPQRPGHKLWLCGKAICQRLLDKKLPIPTLVVLVDEEK